MEFHFNYFIVGFIGALVPEIIRLYKVRFSHKMDFPILYYAISILFALFGGIIVWILQVSNYLNAIYVGVATPLLISGLYKNISQGRTRVDRENEETISDGKLTDYIDSIFRKPAKEENSG